FRPEFFGVPVHGKIFGIIKEFKKMGRDFCPASVAQFFTNDADLQHVGGEQYLKDLACNIISTISVKAYANHLLALHYRRASYALSGKIMDLSLNADFSEPPESLIAKIEGMLAETRLLKTGDNLVGAKTGIMKAIENAQQPTKGVPTGMPSLDKITAGGFKGAQLITIGGRPGMGKSAIGLTLAVNAARLDSKVLFFSLEMSADGLWQRVLSRYSGMAVHSGEVHPTEWQRVYAHSEAMQKLPLMIDESAGLTALDICSKSAHFKRKNGLDIIFIDYLTCIKAADPKANRVHQIEEITQSLKGLSKTLDVPVILLAQLNRAVEGRDNKRPGLSDLRDSGAIEQDSDMVMFVHREEYYNKKGTQYDDGAAKQKAEDYAAAIKGKAELIVAKNRQGYLATIDLNFSGRRQEFWEENLV
ncbi:MAG: AAA family ATPase, partial [Patescibacteria group bacterium]|nr:AAA family ATPase [Patescibacteria group bacterium]